MSADKTDLHQLHEVLRHPRAAVAAHDVVMVIVAWFATRWALERISGVPFSDVSFPVGEFLLVIVFQGLVLWATGLC